MSSLQRFADFCIARETIRLRRACNLPPPWTKDPILSRYRFCNVNREHDTVTKWIDANIRKPYANDHRLWFNLCVARLFNWPDTLHDIGYIKQFDADKIIRVCNARKAKGLKVFTGAYIVSTNGVTMDKAEYVVRRVLSPLWVPSMARDKCLLPVDEQHCGAWADFLTSYDGFGDFIANQVVTDMKYTPILKNASDRRTFCLAGPGTKRGLNRLLGVDKDAPMSQDAANATLRKVRGLFMAGNTSVTEHFEDLNNLSNCFCEWDKYERVRLGEGRPRATYTPAVTK